MRFAREAFALTLFATVYICVAADASAQVPETTAHAVTVSHIDPTKIPRGVERFELGGSGAADLTFMIADSVKNGRQVVWYRSEGRTASGVASTVGWFDARTGRTLFERYLGPDGSVEAAGDATYSAPQRLPIDSGTITDVQLPLVLASLPLQDAAIYRVKVQAVRPYAANAEWVEVAVHLDPATSANPDSVSMWRIECKKGVVATTYLLAVSDRRLLAKQMMMFDGNTVELRRMP